MSKPGQLTNTLDSAYSLAGIVGTICARAGVPAGRVDLRNLQASVDGFSLTNQYGAFTAIAALGNLYFFDAANFDGRLNFVPRGGAPVATLTFEDLVDDGTDIRKQTRLDSISVPRVLHLNYYELNGGLQPNIATSDRSIDTRAVSEVSANTVAILQEQDAFLGTVIAHKILIEEARGGLEFSLPDSWLKLTVSDIIVLEGRRLRITECSIDEGYQKYRTVFDRASAYDAVIGTTSGVFDLAPTPPPANIIGLTTLEVIDSHILSDTDDLLGVYLAANSVDPDWHGARISVSIDGGVTYESAVDVTQKAVMGATTATVGSHNRYYKDPANVIQVELVNTDLTLYSATDVDLLNGKNRAIVGDEIVQFQTATETAPGMWELSGLLRGRNGTAAVAHGIGERFVLLARSSLRFIPLSASYLGREVTLKVLSHGSLSTEQIIPVTLVGRSQTEEAPEYLTTRKISTRRIEWSGTGRLGSGANASHGLYFDRYRVTINGDTYETSDQFLDLADYPSPVNITVGQINKLTGLGATRSLSA